MPSNDYGLVDVLKAAPSTEPSTFFEFIRELDDPPKKGERERWRDLFETVRSAEELGLVEVERQAGNIESIQLTAEGVETLREFQELR